MNIGSRAFHLAALGDIIGQYQRCQFADWRAAFGEFEKIGIMLWFIHETYSLQLHKTVAQNLVVGKQFRVYILQLF